MSDQRLPPGDALLSALSAFERFVVFGPDPIDPHEPPGVLETLLPWPIRLLLTVGLAVAASVYGDTPPAPQLSWGLAYAGAVAVSLASSLWWLIFAGNAVLGLAWLGLTFLPPPDPRRNPIVWGAQHVVEFANRQVSHIEAFWIWMAVVLELVPRLGVQLPLLAALILLGPSLVNGFTAFRHPGARKSSGELQALRRPTIYALTLVGLALVVVRSLDAQIPDLFPLAGAILVGAALRGWRQRLRRRLLAATAPDAQASVRQFRRQQRRLTRKADVGLGPVLAVIGLLGLLALVGLSLSGRRNFQASQRGALDGPPPATEACVPEQGGPSSAQVTLFLAADSHSHELGGDRFPGQTELTDVLGTSALRPVEQDLLSTVTVRHFGRTFNSLIKDGGPPVWWAHLGDLTDLSCTGELDRAFASFAGYGAERLAGVASGNHDTAFTGNFSWSPFWSDACRPGARMDKATSLDRLKTFSIDAGIARRNGQVEMTEGSGGPRWLGGRAGAVMTVTPLGTVQDRGRTRGLGAIFIDSTDGQATSWGSAGLFGSFSSAQDQRLRQMVAALPGKVGAADSAAYGDPIWLVFSHHRVGDLAGPSGKRLRQFLAWLDHHPAPLPAAASETWRDPAEGRTLAIVSAHTHVAESHRHCIGPEHQKRLIRELVIGSMIDPPQQAAVLEVGTGPKGVAAARLRTLPSIGRPGFTCGDRGSTLDAARCRQVIGDLKRAPACDALFVEPTLPGPECSALERNLTLRERLSAQFAVQGVFSPQEIRDDQVIRARNLLACVCRAGAPGAEGGACQAVAGGADPFDKGITFDVLDQRLAGGEASDTELTCLGWAAAAVEGYKAAGMTMSTALRCAFDDTTLPPAQELVASLDVHPCR